MSRILRTLYQKLLTLYPQAFRERLSESMEQTFNDLYQQRQTKGGQLGFIAWIFLETGASILREHMLSVTEGAMMKNSMAIPRSAVLISSILLALAFFVAPWIYLVGNLRDALGPFSYDLADFLYGPVWAASLVFIVFVLRERIGAYAPRRMSMALAAAILAAALMVIVACIRSANRHYHLMHPELHLEDDATVLIVWTTLVTGLTNAGWHFLGWALVLIGSAGWTSGRLPRLLSVLYLLAGVSALFVYLVPVFEGSSTLLGVVLSLWQGIWLWRTTPEEMSVPELNTGKMNQT